MKKLLQLLLDLAPLVVSNGSAVTAIISTIVDLVSLGIEEVKTTGPIIKQIIGVVKENAPLTDEERATLDEQESKIDAAFEAAASEAGYPADDGVPKTAN